MDCQDIEKLQERARDVSLPSLVADAVATHVSCCVKCAARTRAEEQMNAGLATLRAELAEVEVPESYREAVKQRLVLSISGAAPRRKLSPVLAAAAALLAMVMLGGGGFLGPHGEGESSASTEGLLTDLSTPAGGATFLLAEPTPMPLRQVDFDPSKAELIWSNEELEFVRAETETDSTTEGATLVQDTTKRKKRAIRVDF